MASPHLPHPVPHPSSSQTSLAQLRRKRISFTLLPANYRVYNLPNDVHAHVGCGLLPPPAITGILTLRQAANGLPVTAGKPASGNKTF